MTFEEWIATQDESKFDLDPASVESIKDWFRYREICDDDKMETFFWRQLRLYRYKYKQLLRMETTEIDPLVNRYFEAEYTTNQSTSGTSTNGSTSETSVSHSGTNAGTTTYGATVTNSGNDVTAHNTTVATTDQGTNTQTDGRVITDRTAYNSTLHTEGRDENTESDGRTITDSTQYGKTVASNKHGKKTQTDTRVFSDRQDYHSTFTDHDKGSSDQTDGRTITDTNTIAYASNDTETYNQVRDAAEKWTLNNRHEHSETEDTRTEDTNTEDNRRTLTKNSSNTVAQHAEKIAPMSASGITTGMAGPGMKQTGTANRSVTFPAMSSGSADTDTYSVPTHGTMDFEYATGYNQTDGYSDTSNDDHSEARNAVSVKHGGKIAEEKWFTYDSPQGDKESNTNTKTGNVRTDKGGQDTHTNVRTVTGDPLHDEHDNTVTHTRTGYDENTKKVNSGNLTDTYEDHGADQSSGTDTVTHSVRGDLVNVTEKDDTQTHTGTDTVTRSVTGNLQDTHSNTVNQATTGNDTLQHGHVVTNGGSDSTSGTTSGTSSSETEVTATGSTSSSTTGTNRNRYTGREGLTPQEGLSRAMDYLMGYSPAFAWLKGKLEPCFIGILDTDDYYCI